jgi:hypothetical protein
MAAAREDGRHRRSHGTRPGRIETGRRRSHEIEYAAAGGFALCGTEGARSDRRDIGYELTDRFHRHQGASRQRGFTVLASVIGGARFMAPLSS